MSSLRPVPVLLALALLLLAPAARADVIHLANGGKYRGKIVEETSRVVTIETKAGKIRVPRGEISRIVREAEIRAEYEARRGKLEKVGDAADWCELGSWAKDEQLEAEATQCFTRAIELDPHCEPARRALGHKLHQGRWYEPDAYRREVLGLVEYQGRWVTPEEKTNLEAGLELRDGRWVLPEKEGEGEDAASSARPEAAERRAPAKPKKPTSTEEDEDDERRAGRRRGRGAKFRVMSFNVRYDFEDDGPNRWRHRVAAVAKVIQQAAVVGIQEDKGEQVDDLRPLLPGYEIVGGGRNPTGSGERCSILVRRDDARLREWGEFWLSDTPEVQGSNTWGDRYPRKVTWALIELKGARTPLLFLNTHLPERDNGRDPENRIKGARVMNEFIANKVPEKERGKVAILISGDYNSTPDEEPRRVLVDGLGLRDAWAEAPHPGAQHGSYNGFRGFQGNDRIDWLLVGGPARVRLYQTFTEQVDGRWPSDHYPITADLELR